MTVPDYQLIAYRIPNGINMRIEAARAGRDWMNATNAGFANRCLPMRIAGQAGWNILNDRKVRAIWSGDSSPNALIVENSGSPPYAALSHFGEGILTFTIPFLFRTPRGLSLLIRGPANMPKDAVAPLEALVETDWAVAGASVNWKFTRPGVWVEFAEAEPICMIVPQQLELCERAIPTLMDMRDDAELHHAFTCWSDSTRLFNERLRQRDPAAVTLGWQQFYLRGGAPHAGDRLLAGPDMHKMKLNLQEFGGGDSNSKKP